ncbi:MAG: S8 family serine peptidase [Vicinamibacterales bacterium]
MSVSPRVRSVLLTFVFALLANGPAMAQGRHSKLDRVLREAARNSSSVQSLRVIVQTRPGTRAAVKRSLQSHGDQIVAEHPSLEGLTVTIHQEDLGTLEANPSVLAVSVDADVTSFGRSRLAKYGKYKKGDTRNSPAGLNVLRTSLGLDSTHFFGFGVKVAIVDSGIAPTQDVASKIAGFWDFTRGGVPTAPYDDYGHGTHLAGLIASSGIESNYEYAGVAPGVRLYGLKVLDKSGRGRSSDVVRALEWIAANKRSTAPGAVKIDIVNLSLGHPVFEPAESDPLVRAVENLVSAGVVVVAAAGNKGQDEDGGVGYAGITSPGNAPSAITVGAVDTKNTPTRSDDRVAFFSARGPTWFDGFAKPEIVAPGVGLASDVADNSELYVTYPQLKLKGKYREFARLSGTSMAAATATGVAALALEASRWANHGAALKPNCVKAVLQFTAVPVLNADGQSYEPLAQGAGQVNGRGAISLAYAVNTEIPVGHPWLRTHVRPSSVIAGDELAWSETLVWRDSTIRGSDALTIHSEFWDDNIVWGTGCDTDDAQCVATVWGAAADVNNIVWGTGLTWAEDLVWRNRVVGFLSEDDNIVWGTIAGLTEDNIVWGTFFDDNIVWGTVARRDASGAPLWGLVSDDNIVWGTFFDLEAARRSDNIVWGTLRGDNIVWGTLDALPEGGRQ